MAQRDFSKKVVVYGLYPISLLVPLGIVYWSIQTKQNYADIYFYWIALLTSLLLVIEWIYFYKKKWGVTRHTSIFLFIFKLLRNDDSLRVNDTAHR